jgi:cell division protein FtsL
LGRKNANGRSKTKNNERKGKRKRRTKDRKGLTFGFLMMLLFLLACMGVFMVAMHQGALSKDLSASRVEQKIAQEKTKQKSLRMSLARLKSPGRITRVATDELGLSEPTAVIYLKYTKDGNGNIICQSNYEKTEEQPARKNIEEQTVQETNGQKQTVQEKNGQQEKGTEQSPQNGKTQASIKTEISPNVTTR